jgi:hypothetical protein
MWTCTARDSVFDRFDPGQRLVALNSQTRRPWARRWKDYRDPVVATMSIQCTCVERISVVVLLDNDAH